ncbi:hypothetical protein BMS3Abin02_00294 [bacterium BMS3Abin02]|nr:hypothetical protein BMS3Abin02_00294 [bacterium BMS3Abin02]GBE23446.1 hypothetical protein BMS3Bbin01_02830 [bacterium BMS3Bbin01]HDH26451.1 hypothetical protein [Actinomycetota bacterium]
MSESYELDADVLDGPTMGAVARWIGRSERHTRRLIRELTHRLGVDHPRAALALAGQMGWVDVAASPVAGPVFIEALELAGPPTAGEPDRPS